MLNKDLQKVVEFMVENKPLMNQSCAANQPVTFTITPDSLQNVKIVSFVMNALAR